MDYLTGIYEHAARMDENSQRRLYHIAKKIGKEHRRPRVDPDDLDADQLLSNRYRR